MEKNEKINLNKPEYFFNRELSWLKFNLRVLREAGVKTTPLLERLKFVAITASNLDEFFMVRVAGLWDQYENGINKRDAAGLTVKAQLEEISKAAHDQMKLLNKYLLSLVKELREAGIYICRVSELSEKGRRWLEAYYQEEIFPVLTPMAVDASRPFPFLANKTLNLAVELTNQEGEDSMGIVQVPSVLPRLLEVPGEEKRSFVFLEDVINEHCSDLYSGCKILDVVPFRITRDADLEFDEDDIDNLLKEVEKLRPTAASENSCTIIWTLPSRRFMKLTGRLTQPAFLNLLRCRACGPGCMSHLCRSARWNCRTTATSLRFCVNATCFCTTPMKALTR